MSGLLAFFLFRPKRLQEETHVGHGIGLPGWKVIGGLSLCLAAAS